MTLLLCFNPSPLNLFPLNQVIENLVQQKARGELIALLYDEQEDSATSIFKTVASVSYSLKQRKSQFYDRMVCGGNVSLRVEVL